MGKVDIAAAHKPKTAKGKRFLDKRQPKEVEDEKRLLVLHGNKVSQVVKDVLVDLLKLKKGRAVKFTRKNEIWPFEAGQETSLQFFCERADCALFCLGNHNKKRPHNIVLGRIFNAQLLDMIEFGVSQHVSLEQFPGARRVQPTVKPCFLFVGEAFENDERFRLAKSLLLDLLRGQEVEHLNLMAVSRVVVCSSVDGVSISLRHYAVLLKKSGTRVPRIELEEAGPRLALTVRRSRVAPKDLEKEALTHPKLGKTKQKNTGFEELHGKVGRIYMPAQDVGEVAQAKAKGTKRTRRDAAAARKKQKVAAGPDAAGGSLGVQSGDDSGSE